MPSQVTNYDGSITASLQQLVYPQTVEEIQAILRDPVTYPSPVCAVDEIKLIIALSYWVTDSGCSVILRRRSGGI